jgi:hypothetical protein
MFKTIKTAQDIQAEKDQAARESRITELKRLLAETDYKVMPDYDKPSTKIVDDRQSWRDEIRKLVEEG